MRKSFVTIAALCVAAVPGAAIAGTVVLTASLSGANETAGGDPAASGTFRVEIDPEAGDFCYTLAVTKLAKPAKAHVHSGVAGVDGDPVAMIEITGAGNDECIALEPDKLKPIVANPAAYYVNVHSAAFPAGAVRGQLGAGQ